MKTNQSQKNIPNGWKLYQLKQLGEFKNGVNKSKEDFGHGSPFVNLMDIFGYPSIWNKKFDLVNVSSGEIQNYSLRKGDVLFVRSSVKPEGVGLATLVEEDLNNTVYSGFIIRFRSDYSLISHGFKKYSFQNSTFRNRLIATSSVSANTNINQEALNKLPVLLPPLLEQTRIVSVLETWDKSIENLNKKIEIKKQIKKGLIQDLLTGKKRLKGFKDKWETVRLGDVAKMGSGGTPKSTNESYFGGDILWVSIADMTANGKYIYSTLKNLSKDGLENSSAKIYPKGTILYAMYASIGECSIAGVPMTSSQAILGIISNKEKLDSLFLYFHLCSIKGIIKLQGQQGTQSNLNAGIVKDFKLKLPNIKEQNAIADILTIADKEITELEKKLLIVKDQKKYLLNNLITGTIRTPETLSTNSIK